MNFPSAIKSPISAKMVAMSAAKAISFLDVSEAGRWERSKQKYGEPNSSKMAIESCSAPLKAAVAQGVFDSVDELEVPVAQFYDMDLFDYHLESVNAAFGPTFHHRMAVKSSALSRLLKYAYKKWEFGVETASMGELRLALDHCGIPASHIVFDSPAKTCKELEYGIRKKIHTNFDNFVEYERAKKIIVDEMKWEEQCTETLGPLGIRINPLVGAGTIAALSVSTSDSKFGIPVTEKEKILEAYQESPWMTSLHVHVGSGGMGVQVLAAGVRVLVDLAKEINACVGRKQIVVLDIGGGLPANYGGDSWAADKVPTHYEYATHLRENIPELFSGEFQVLTEFGQSMFAKTGFLASRLEWFKGTPENPIAVVHFGADLCVRQAYTKEHARRIEAYRKDGSDFGVDAKQKQFQVAGPLCFQGDFSTKNALLPGDLAEGDLLVMKDAGANTLSMHSRHCSRLAPPVYGYRWKNDKEIDSLAVIKSRETLQQLYDFWGPC